VLFWKGPEKQRITFVWPNHGTHFLLQPYTFCNSQHSLLGMCVFKQWIMNLHVDRCWLLPKNFKKKNLEDLVWYQSSSSLSKAHTTGAKVARAAIGNWLKNIMIANYIVFQLSNYSFNWLQLRIMITTSNVLYKHHCCVNCNPQG